MRRPPLPARLPTLPRPRLTLVRMFAGSIGLMLVLAIALASAAGDDGKGLPGVGQPGEESARDPRVARPAPVPTAAMPRIPPPTSTTPAPAVGLTTREPEARGRAGRRSRAARGPADRSATPDSVVRAFDARRFSPGSNTQIQQGWVDPFMALYEISARTHGITWLLLASVHKQETAFSTAPTTYRGLNFANCCGGPMQFNVTNGPVSTWDRYKDAYRAASRPANYNHRSARHPSLYDDFDAIMAAGALMRDNGGGTAIDGSFWRAAYLYYGRDLDGVDYASTVTARALSWARNGFCINCGVDPGLVSDVDGMYGAAERQILIEADERAERLERAKERAKRKRIRERRQAARERREAAQEARQDAARQREEAAGEQRQDAAPDERPSPPANSTPQSPPPASEPSSPPPSTTTPDRRPSLPPSAPPLTLRP